MALATANTNFQRQITLLRASSKVPGFRILALSVADPNGSVAPQALTIAMATDSSFWKSDGTTWTLVAGGGGGSLYPDDVFAEFGSGTAGDGGNVNVGVTTAYGDRVFIIEGEDYTGISAKAATIPYKIQTGDYVVTDAAIGSQSGSMTIATGNTDSTNAGGTGGPSGALLITTGAAASTLGTSGATGSFTAGTGISVDGASGEVLIGSGPSGSGSGDSTFRTGNTTAGSSGDLTLRTGTGTTDTGGVIVITGAATAGGSGNVSVGTGNALSNHTSGQFVVSTGTTVNGASGIAALFTGAVSGSGDSGNAGLFSGANTGTGDTGAVGVQSGNVTGTGTSGNVDIKTGSSSAGASGSINLVVLEGASANGSINLVTNELMASMTPTGFVPSAAPTGTGQTVGVVPSMLRFTVDNVSGSTAVTMACNGTIFGLEIIKTGGTGIAGDTIAARTTTGIFFPAQSLTGLADGAITYAQAFATTAAFRTFTMGEVITLTSDNTGGAVSCEVYIHFYRT